MRILVINNDDGGFADYVEVDAGFTVAKLFAQQVSHGKSRDYLIRVNRQPTAPDQVLQEGDASALPPPRSKGRSALRLAT